MDIHILGGFLGSGKTTLLMHLAKMFTDKGKKISIIVNEAGSIGVDGTTISGQGYNAVELPEGCVCCTLVGSLIDAVNGICRDYNPDVLIIEPTGMALPGKVKETLDVVNGRFFKYDRIDIVGMLDGPRFNLFVSKKAEFYLKQLIDSDIIAVNKIDITPEGEYDKIKAWCNENIPNAKVFPTCALTGENLDKVFSVIE